MRDACKVALLGSAYGMTAYGLAMAVKIPLVTSAEIQARLRDRYRTFFRWRDDVVTAGLGRPGLLFPPRSQMPARNRAVASFGRPWVPRAGRGVLDTG
jgi:hypothetical protein